MKIPIRITDWDARWPLEHVFQAVAVALARERAGATLQIIDTSTVAVPGEWNRFQKGAPDIVACRGGKYVAIELKSAYGKPTAGQTAERERTENALGTYVTAWTMREVFEALGLETD